jgi:small subunit ribosomal protein S13
MPRILGVDIPGKKRVEISLRYIYGIGPAKALEIMKKARVKPGTKADDLSDEQIAAITTLLQNDYVVEGDLRRLITGDIRRLQAIGSYRGVRHRRGLPCRGQRTKTNARTRKGKKVTVGAIRDKTQRKIAGKDEGSAAPAAAPAAAAPAKPKK